MVLEWSSGHICVHAAKNGSPYATTAKFGLRTRISAYPLRAISWDACKRSFWQVLARLKRKRAKADGEGTELWFLTLGSLHTCSLCQRPPGHVGAGRARRVMPTTSLHRVACVQAWSKVTPVGYTEPVVKIRMFRVTGVWCRGHEEGQGSNTWPTNVKESGNIETSKRKTEVILKLWSEGRAWIKESRIKCVSVCVCVCTWQEVTSVLSYSPTPVLQTLSL